MPILYDGDEGRAGGWVLPDGSSLKPQGTNIYRLDEVVSVSSDEYLIYVHF